MKPTPAPTSTSPKPPAASGPAPSARYAALVARDARFDGRFFVGVTSTGIYCRPVCRVRTPREANCRFFDHPAAAEGAGYRPCLRCRPEQAPGWSGIDLSQRLAWAAAQRIEAGALDDGDVAALAARLGITDRHLRRLFGQTFGVSPVDYAQTQRLLTAKRLLADTTLPLTEVASAAGFGSLRRFNALFQRRYELTPGEMRRASTPAAPADGLRFTLAARPPFDGERLLAFLAARCVAGVEQVDLAAGVYRRSVRLVAPGDDLARERQGWLAIRLPRGAEAPAVIALQVDRALAPALAPLLSGVRRLCDLSCDPQAVTQALGALASDAPGLRLPGAFDGFELAVRAILGQQVTVKAAHTLAGRLVAALGEPITTPWPAIDRLFPTPQRVAATPVEAVAALGIVRSRAAALIALARAVTEGALDLGPAADVEAVTRRLLALPGIGRWTANYIALRALGWPDAWPSGDVALRKALGVASDRAADARAEAWRPWRGYAVMHLWRRLAEGLPAFESVDVRPPPQTDARAEPSASAYPISPCTTPI